MEKNHATPILASYVTYKELSSHGNYKSPYQILAEFIKYIIYEKKLYAFSIGEIKSRVENEFESINEQIQNIAQKKDTLCRRMYN